MTKRDEYDKGKFSAVLHWMEKLLIALCGILVGAVGSGKFGVSPIGVTVALPSDTNQTPKEKVCVTEPLRTPPTSIVGIATFANGDSSLTEFARQNVQIWANALSRCEGLDLQLIGSTSSIPFRSGHLKNNVLLAIERSNAVADVFSDAGLNSIEVQGVTSEKELDLLRIINDRRDGKTDDLLAAAARRVDLKIWSLGSCAFGER